MNIPAASTTGKGSVPIDAERGGRNGTVGDEGCLYHCGRNDAGAFEREF